MRILVILVGILLLAGCSYNKAYVYKPSAPVTGGARFLIRIAVLPFKDATEDFTTRGGVFTPNGLTVNLVKSGIPGTNSALTPELWAKAFADDLAASGSFQAVRFIYSRAELQVEDMYIEGTVDKAYAIGSWDKPNEIAISLRALRQPDNLPVWHMKVARSWTPRINPSCGLGVQCVIDQRYADLTQVMQELFAEARENLLGILANSSGNPTGAEPKSGSVDEIIKDILEEK